MAGSMRILAGRLSCIAAEASGRFSTASLKRSSTSSIPCSAPQPACPPRDLKKTYGEHFTFWGGGVDTQHVLPFGTPDEVRDQVRERIEIFAPGGGFVFCSIHNIQARTPIENLLAMFETIREYR